MNFEALRDLKNLFNIYDEFLELTFLGPKHLQNSTELLKSLQFIIYFNFQMLSFFHYFLFYKYRNVYMHNMFSQTEFFQIYLV